VNASDEMPMIREAVETTFRDAGRAWPPVLSGPIPLGDLIAHHPVVHEEVDGLNRAAASAVLRRWDVRWAEIPRDDPPLAGFLYANSRSGFIFVRRGDNLPRRRFTAAHELGHYRLHLGPTLAREALELVEVDRDEEVEESAQLELAAMERQANRFAAELLMPEPVCRALHERYARKYGAVDRCLVYHLAGDLLVSRAAIAWRLFGLGLIKKPNWLAGAVGESKGTVAAEAE
jgi:Zn-dependent peptidase ImmA (M78 family)